MSYFPKWSKTYENEIIFFCVDSNFGLTTNRNKQEQKTATLIIYLILKHYGSQLLHSILCAIPGEQVLRISADHPSNGTTCIDSGASLHI